MTVAFGSSLGSTPGRVSLDSCTRTGRGTLGAMKSVSGTPVEKVVSLPQDLKGEVTTEGANEATAYDKFACFCKDTTLSKSASIVAGQIDATSARMAAGTATKQEKMAGEKDQACKVNAVNATAKWLERLELVLKPKHMVQFATAQQDFWDYLDHNKFAENVEYEAKLKEYEAKVNKILRREYVLTHLHNDDVVFMKHNFNYMGGCECRFCRPWQHRCQIRDLFHGCDCVPRVELEEGCRTDTDD